MCPLVEMLAEFEAQQRWQSGEPPSFSSDLADQITAGYGKLDEYGNWEFPLFPGSDYLTELNQRIQNLK